MKKSIQAALSILAINLMSITHAEYVIKIPMEQNLGGLLPTSSIIFKQVENQPEPTPTIPDGPWDCINQAANYPEECDKRVTAWNSFFMSNGISNNWKLFSAVGKNLSSLPIEPFPLTSMSSVFLGNNKLTHVDSLSNLDNINGTLSLSMNPITNLNGIKNIKVGTRVIIEPTYSGPKLPANSRFCMLNDPSIFYVGYAQKDQLCEK